MPVFRLTPIDLSHSDWDASSHKGECRVHAVDEDTAREYATIKFRKGPGRQSVQIGIPLSPWENPKRVNVDAIPEFDLSATFDGLVEIPDPTGEYSPYDQPIEKTEAGPEGSHLTLPSIQIKGTGPGVEPEGAHLTLPSIQIKGTGPGMEPEGAHLTLPSLKSGGSAKVEAKLRAHASGTATVHARVIRAVTPQVVSRVVANKEVLVYQARSLLAFLDDVLEPKPGSNMGPPQLWALGIEEDKDDELSEQLSQLRGGLGQVLAALESEEPEKENLSTALTGLQKVGWNFLNTASVVIATGTGLLFLTYVATFLDSAGIVPWDNFIELAKALRG